MTDMSVFWPVMMFSLALASLIEGAALKPDGKRSHGEFHRWLDAGLLMIGLYAIVVYVSGR